MDNEIENEVEGTVIELGAVSEETKGIMFGAESLSEPTTRHPG